MQSPKWARTLLIYTYDEHGGYYDHVAPPAAIPPDDIAPTLSPGDPPGGYDMYGPRVPAIVVSPYSRPGGVTDVIHDHTSILATIQAKWNLPGADRPRRQRDHGHGLPRSEHGGPDDPAGAGDAAQAAGAVSAGPGPMRHWIGSAPRRGRSGAGDEYRTAARSTRMNR